MATNVGTSQWQSLAAQAHKEMDGQKLLTLIRQLCTALDRECGTKQQVEQPPIDVDWEWFDLEIMQRKFKGWEGCLPEQAELPSVVKDYPGIEFAYYRLQDEKERRGSIFAVGEGVLLCEHHTPNGVQVQRYSPPSRSPF